MVDLRPAAADVPLIADLDGTLIKTDLLIESFFLLAATRPGRACKAALGLRHGKTALKAAIADHAIPDMGSLPFNAGVLDFLRAEKAKGRRIYLASASDIRYVRAIAAHLGLFDGVFGSDGAVNLSGTRKAELLCREFGEGAFDYIGNAKADIPVWERCRKPVAANAAPALLAALRRRFAGLHEIGALRPAAADYARGLRVHQWSKNALLFVPLLAGHALTLASLVPALLAFLAFSLCASSVYLLNDLLDLPHDRDHATKRRRPLASGAMPLGHGVALVPLLLLVSLGLALAVSPEFLAMLTAYYVTALLYSLLLKRHVVIDVMTLAGLYALRMFAGGVVAGLPVSEWLMAFSIFLFLFLAIVKRYTELAARQREGLGAPKGRGYQVGDLPIVGALASASGYISVLVLALYIHSPEVHVLYQRPSLLWIICGLLLYWVTRVMILAHRGVMHDDPVVFAIKDGISLMMGVLVLAVMAFSA